LHRNSFVYQFFDQRIHVCTRSASYSKIVELTIQWLSRSFMLKRRFIGLLGCCLTVLLAAPAAAETVLERVNRTGTLTAGTRSDSVPFAYTNENGELVGYSIDLLKLIHRQLEQELAKDIELNLVEVTLADRFSKVENNEVDILCGATTYTSSRARRVDFSVGFFRTGTQFLVKRDGNRQDMSEFRVGVIGGSTNAEVVQGYLKIAQYVVLDSRAAGLEALNNNRIDALASDGILLSGLRQSTDNPDAYEILPTLPIQPETYACIVPKGNPDFLELVNQTLLGFMQALVEDDPVATSMFNTWFGTEGAVPIDREPLFDFFQRTIEYYQPRSATARDLEPTTSDAQPLIGVD
jgi:polar amino acid transport system substrate-binding protein